MDEFLGVVQNIFSTCKTKEELDSKSKEMTRIIIKRKLLNKNFNSLKLNEVN